MAVNHSHPHHRNGICATLCSSARYDACNPDKAISRHPQSQSGPMRLEYYRDVSHVGVTQCDGTIFLDGCSSVSEVRLTS